MWERRVIGENVSLESVRQDFGSLGRSEALIPRPETVSSMQDSQARPVLSLGDVGVWLSLLAALAIPLYSLGLIELTAQIAFTYELDYSTAWYAASLVPDKVVLGQGLRVVIAQPVYFATILVSLVTSIRSYQRSAERWQEIRLEAAKISGVAEQLKAAGPDEELERQLRASLDRVDELAEESRQSRMPRWFRKWFAPLFLVLWLVSFVLAFIGRQWSFVVPTLTTLGASGLLLFVADVFARRRIPFRWTLPVTFLVAYAGAAIVAAVSAGLSEPPLPAVKIDAQPPRQGQLITHTDGYWHILTRGALVAVPDSGVGSVVVTRSP